MPYSQRTIDQLLSRYRDSHRHPTNELIHVICVPAIVFALLGLLWALHPLLALLVVGAALVYYHQLSRPFAIGMAVMALACIVVLALLPRGVALPLAIAVFVIAWLGQFIGHQIEGKKPTFLEDLRFLLIGPLFVLSILYRRFKLAW
jgi:uncharacterized membrane protein YGL010W